MIEPIGHAPPKPKYTTRTTCRVCDSPLEDVLDLGPIYVSDFPTEAELYSGIVCPLTLTTCTSPSCRLVQLRHTVDRDLLYRRYWYRSGINPMMRANLQGIVERVRRMVDIRATDCVVDIGANDGTLLKHYRDLAVPAIRVAFEPATNLLEDLRENAAPMILIPDYFPSDRYDGPRAKVVTSIAMFYDLEHPDAFVSGVRRLLDPEGVWVLELSYLPWMLERNAFDSICHEHLEYYSLTSLKRLLNRHGLWVVDVELNDVNGASMRVFVKRQGHYWRHAEAADRVDAILNHERTYFRRRFDRFLRRVKEIQEQVLELIDDAVSRGHSVDVYGASTKGNTLLQYFGIDDMRVRQAIERSPEKWGRYTVGTRIPIVSEEDGRRDPAEVWLCPIWHFREAVVEREGAYLEGGGEILFPLPNPEVVLAREIRPLRGEMKKP